MIFLTNQLADFSSVMVKVSGLDGTYATGASAISTAVSASFTFDWTIAISAIYHL
jgi:hypothetical protein